jgi:hypothetical protein
MRDLLRGYAARKELTWEQNSVIKDYYREVSIMSDPERCCPWCGAPRCEDDPYDFACDCSLADYEQGGEDNAGVDADPGL